MYKAINRQTGYGFLGTWNEVRHLDNRLWDITPYTPLSTKWEMLPCGIEVKKVQ